MQKRNRPVILGVGDVSEILGISRQHVRKLSANGKIPHQTASCGLVFLKDEILEYLKYREEKSKIDPRIRIKKT